MELEEVIDNSQGSRTFNVYLKGQKYEGVDQVSMRETE
jgi:hypothetical protein